MSSALEEQSLNDWTTNEVLKFFFETLHTYLLISIVTEKK